MDVLEKVRESIKHVEKTASGKYRWEICRSVKKGPSEGGTPALSPKQLVEVNRMSKAHRESSKCQSSGRGGEAAEQEGVKYDRAREAHRGKVLQGLVSTSMGCAGLTYKVEASECLQ